MKNLLTILFLFIASCSRAQKYYLGFLPKAPIININLTNAIIVCDGNSLTYGYQSSNPPTTGYPNVMHGLVPFNTNGATIYNFGVSSQTTGDMLSDVATQVYPLYSSSVTSIVVAYEIGNDIYFNGRVDSAEARFQRYCLGVKAVGFKVVVVTLTPRDQTTAFGDSPSTYQGKIDAINTWLRANYLSFADAIADLQADSRFTTYNTTYFNGDKVHYTDAGYAAMADIIKTAILSL